MAETWPAGAPSTLQGRSYVEMPADNIIRTSMGVGPDKLRRRATAGIIPFSGTIEMTTTELATFNTFYTTTLYDGVLTFDFTHPRTSAAIECRFAEHPTFNHIGGDSWYVDVKMEILP